MAVLSIREYAHMPALSEGPGQIGAEDGSRVSQTITLGGASLPSAAFAATTKFIRVRAGAACSLEFGVAPVAVAGSCDMSAGDREYFAVTPGQKVAAITI